MSMRAAAWALSRPAPIRSSSAASSETDDRISGSADISGPMVVDIGSSCELEKIQQLICSTSPSSYNPE